MRAIKKRAKRVMRKRRMKKKRKMEKGERRNRVCTSVSEKRYTRRKCVKK
jgi:hypothetical protein